MHRDGHHGNNAGKNQCIHPEGHSCQRIGCKGGDDEHEHKGKCHNPHAADEIPEEAVGHNLNVILSVPWIRKVEYTLLQHVKLLAEGVQDHEDERRERNHQLKAGKDNGNRPRRDAFSLLFCIVNFSGP